MTEAIDLCLNQQTVARWSEPTPRTLFVCLLPAGHRGECDYQSFAGDTTTSAE